MTLRLHSDERGFVISFLVKAIIVVLLLGLVVIEGGAVLFARLQAQDIAETAAAVGSGALKDTGDIRVAERATLTAVHDKNPGARLTGFRPREDGSVRVTVTLRARTLLIHRIGIGFLEDLTVARGTAVGRPPPA